MTPYAQGRTEHVRLLSLEIQAYAAWGTRLYMSLFWSEIPHFFNEGSTVVTQLSSEGRSYQWKVSSLVLFDPDFLMVPPSSVHCNKGKGEIWSAKQSAKPKSIKKMFCCHVDTYPHMSTHVHTCPQQIAECRQDLSPRSSIGKLTRSHLQKAVASAVTRWASQLRLIVQLPCLACLACGPCSPLVTTQMAPHSSPNLSALCKRSFCDSFPLRFPLRLVKIASCTQLFSAKAQRTDFAFKLCAKRRSKFCKQQNKWHQIACLSGSFHYSTCTLSIWAGDSTSKTA